MWSLAKQPPNLHMLSQRGEGAHLEMKYVMASTASKEHKSKTQSPPEASWGNASRGNRQRPVAKHAILSTDLEGSTVVCSRRAFT